MNGVKYIPFKEDAFNLYPILELKFEPYIAIFLLVLLGSIGINLLDTIGMVLLFGKIFCLSLNSLGIPDHVT